jgi:uronate dehydrogenase
MKRILITGASGRIGGNIFNGLKAMGNYDLIGGDIKPDPDNGIRRMDVTDIESCLALMKDVHTVVHFAYYLASDNFEETIVPVNLIGTYHIYEAARRCGVKRVIFCSSNHTTGFYTNNDKVTADSLYRPDSLYALSKCFGELTGRMYADKYGISSINMRFGTYRADNRPRSLRQTKTWISHADALELTRCCIEADPELLFAAFYGVSNNKHRLWDIEHLKPLIGYEPRDDGSIFLSEIVNQTEEEYDATGYQGGDFIKN